VAMPTWLRRPIIEWLRWVEAHDSLRFTRGNTVSMLR
jgi:hypothetical protein